MSSHQCIPHIGPGPKKVKGGDHGSTTAAATSSSNLSPTKVSKTTDVTEKSNTGPALLAAAKSGDFEKVEKLLRSRCDACYQDPENGQSALMLAAEFGHAQIVSELLISGAPYNAVDKTGKCAGNYAIDHSHSRIVDALIDAGVTAELLFARIAARREMKQKQSNSTSVKPLDQTCGNSSKENKHRSGAQQNKNPDDQKYFKQGVRYTRDGQKLLDDAQDAVMMEWERPLMEAHAKIMIPDNAAPQTMDVLNIGFGMGIIDGYVRTFYACYFSFCFLKYKHTNVILMQ